MNEFQILLTIMLAGFGFIGALLLVIWNRIEGVENRLTSIIMKLDEKITDIDRRVCRIEGSLATRGFCMLKDEEHIKKAE